MSFITLDFETAFKSKAPDKYSLESMTYEEYLYDDRFKCFGVGIKIDAKPAYWVPTSDLTSHLRALFPEGNEHTLLCHNTMFDAAILHWHFGLKPAKYYDTLSMARALWHQKKNGLKELTRRLFPNDPDKWKGDELHTVDGLWKLTEEQEQVLADYCIQDVECTFNCFAVMWQFFPTEELAVIDLTIRMFAEPKLLVDRPRVEQYLEQLKEEKQSLLAEVEEIYQVQAYIADAARVFSDWLSEFCKEYAFSGTFVYQKYSAVVSKLIGWDQKRFETTDIKYQHLYKMLPQAQRPHFFTYHAYKAMIEQEEKHPVERIISSNPAFAAYLDHRYNIKVPLKHSPTPKNKNNYTLALAKDDLEFLEIQKNHQDKRLLWDVRLNLSSSIEQTRAERFLAHSEATGKLAVPLIYGGTQTNRWSGTNKINLQNLGRDSELRKALVAPEGFKVLVSDLSNIEGRVLAWFAGQTDKVEAFREGRDSYSEFASKIYKRPIDRKKKAIHPETGEEYKPHEVEGFVGKICELGLGYGMSPPTFQITLAKGAMGGPQLFFSDDFCREVVNLWRTTNYRIKACWAQADRVIFDMACPGLEPYDWKVIRVEQGRLRLPNNLYLNYPGLKATEDVNGRLSFTYWNGKFNKNVYGGLLVENATQALSRIIMAEMMVTIDKYLRPLGGRIVLTVHDEIVMVVPDEHLQACSAFVEKTMSTPPKWAPDLPLACELDYAQNYSK